MRLGIKFYQKPSLLLILVASSLIPACSHISSKTSQPVAPDQDSRLILKQAKIRKLANGKGEYRDLSISTDGALATNFEIIAMKVNQYQASLYTQGHQQAAANVSTIGVEKGAFLAVNGGFFTPDFTPDGLFYAHGQQLSPYSKQPIFNAMVSIDHQGQLSIGPSTTQYQKSAYAIQAGPLLINQGQMLVTKVNQFNQFAARTVLAESSDGQLIVISTSDMSLYTLENILYQHPEWFGVNKIVTAVNLDGGKSSAIYINSSQTHRMIDGKNKVKDILLFN